MPRIVALTLALVFTLLTLATSAHAQRPPHRGGPVKPVHVVNDPLVVEIINAPPATCDAQKVFAFVGVTEATTDGDIGGPVGATQMCSAEFGPSRMCSLSETRESVSLQLSTVAWVNSGSNCGEWSRNGDGQFGSVIGADGRYLPSSHGCGLFTLPVACCSWVEITE